MIVPDVNLLVHAYNSDSSRHEGAKAWLEDLLSGTQTVGLAWVVLLGFIRITTHRRVVARPLDVKTAVSYVRSWLAQPYTIVVEPTPRHAEILFGLLSDLGAAGNLTTDAHLAALAIEHQAEVCSTDTEFARFPGLRWRDPLR